MSERDEEELVSRLYRGLPREEPAQPLDEAIRAHARRAQVTHAAPLVPPTGRRSWAFPVAAAAVIVLAVAVTSQLEREQPDAELSVTPSSPAAKEEAAGQSAEHATREDKPVLAPKRRADSAAKHKTEPPPAAPPAAAEAPQAAGAPSKQAEQAPPPAAAAAPSPQAAPASRDELRALARSNAAESPEHWLERIAQLRKEGRDEEADRQLAEFRKRYPDYRIAPETLGKVERRLR